jgi:hypothetical protein
MSTTNSEYLLLFRGSEWDHSLSPTELQDTLAKFATWFERLSAEGTIIAGQPLLDEGRVIGKAGRVIADGPYAESKEAVGGYLLIRAESLDHAVEIARQFPILEYGTFVEVRPVAVECPTMQRARQAISHELATAEA